MPFLLLIAISLLLERMASLKSSKPLSTSQLEVHREMVASILRTRATPPGLSGNASQLPWLEEPLGAGREAWSLLLSEAPAASFNCGG